MTNREWWEFINDFWEFIKKHNSPKTDAEWSIAVKDAKALGQKHDRKYGARNLIMELLGIWEKEAGQ